MALAGGLGYSTDDEESADLLALYKTMVSTAPPMLSCIALCFCAHIANFLGTVHVELVKRALAEGMSCFDLEDAKAELTALSGDAVSEAWQSFNSSLMRPLPNQVNDL
ncbi:hypothetical protein EON64_15495 [archaeon]|nr:MAG: hypothetical protein EON64_15495 [archaeon]